MWGNYRWTESNHGGSFSTTCMILHVYVAHRIKCPTKYALHVISFGFHLSWQTGVTAVKNVDRNVFHVSPLLYMVILGQVWPIKINPGHKTLQLPVCYRPQSAACSTRKHSAPEPASPASWHLSVCAVAHAWWCGLSPVRSDAVCHGCSPVWTEDKKRLMDNNWLGQRMCLWCIIRLIRQRKVFLYSSWFIVQRQIVK